MFMFAYDWKQLDVAEKALNHESEEIRSGPWFTPDNNLFPNWDTLKMEEGAADTYMNKTGINQDSLGKTGMCGHSTTY